MVRTDATDAFTAAPDWRGIEKLLDETTQFGLFSQNPRDFYPLLLANATQAVGGRGAGLWVRDSSGEWSLQAGHGMLDAYCSDLAQCKEHTVCVARQALGAHETALASPARGPAAVSTCRLSLRRMAEESHLSLLAPLMRNKELFAALEVWVAGDDDGQTDESRAAVLSAFAEIAADFLFRQQLSELHGVQKNWERWDDSLLRVHASLDKRSTCTIVANELRGLVNCDRVSVLCWERARLRVIAVSGMASFDRRSAVVRAIEQFATVVAGEGRVWWYAEGDAANGPGDELLSDYVDIQPVRAMGIVPLLCWPHSIDSAGENRLGVVVCERFDGWRFDSADQQAIEHLSRHASVAIRRAREFDQLPFVGLSRWLRRIGLGASPRSKLLSATLLLLAAASLALGGLWPVDFSVRASGVLQPVERRDVFAPADGVVRELHVRQGDAVQSGSRLVTLHNDDVELEITRLFGELQTARRQYQAVQASRRDTVRSSTEPRLSSGQLAAEEERLKEVIRSLELQHQRRLAQRDELTVCSPISGEVVTWDIERLLRSRPLRHGQRLMTVARIDGLWSLELRVADADVGHVVMAQQRGESELPVTYRVASEPGRERRGRLTSVADWTDAHDPQGPAVKMLAAIEVEKGTPFRPGGGVAARIHLGKRTRAYVWFRDLWEFLRVHLWF